MAFLALRQDPIGLDIGKASIVGVQLGGRPPAFVLKGLHERPLPEGLVSEGEVVDADGLGAELRAFMKDAPFKGKAVRLGVGNQKVVVRTMELPEMDEEQLRGAIEFQAQDYVPMPLEEVILDFQVVGRYVDAEGTLKQQVVLVAAQRKMIEQFLMAGRKAGVTVDGIDVSAFALVRALTPPVPLVDQGRPVQAVTGFLHVTSSNSTVVVAADGVPLFTRIFGFCFDNFIMAIMESQGVGRDEAAALADLVGLPGPQDAPPEDFSAATVAEVRAELSKVAERLVEEVRHSLDYYQSQEYSLPVASLLLSGRGPMVRNLAPFLGEALGLAVEIGDPLLRVAENKSGLPDEILAGLAPRLAVPIGLVLDEVD